MKSVQRLFRTQIRTNDHELLLSAGSDIWKVIPIADIESITQGGFLGFPFIHIVTRSGGHTVVRGETAPVIEALRIQLEDLAGRCFRHSEASIAGTYPSLKTLEGAWTRTVSGLGNSIPALRSPFASKLLEKSLPLDQVRSLWEAIEKPGDARNQLIRSRIELELVSFKEYFDTVEKMPLTLEQREACVVADDRQLLVAAAGSGKSSTITAKVGYLLKKGWVKPEEIVVLAFNSDAAKEIKERCTERLREIPGIERVTCSTFHAFGRNLSRSQYPNGRIPPVSPMATGEGTALRHSLLRWIVQDLIFSSGSNSTATAFKLLQDVTKGNDSPSVSVKANETRAPFMTLRGETVKSIQDAQNGESGHPSRLKAASLA
ncbi:MAG TPA: UvrD-helicase domain-containing protein, partial [Fibrobacteria bacterium]|nr:UvrD-helicase domain-containing protein [Fibrobacteria bacterium]